MKTKKSQEVKNFLSVRNHGFLRVTVIIPRVYLSDPSKNSESHFEELKKVYKKGAAYALCPELGLTGYSNSDLFFSEALIDSAKNALGSLVHKTRLWNIVITVGLPLVIDEMLFNVAATFVHGRILAVVPKSYPPEYREFYELRHFAEARQARSRVINLLGQEIPFGPDILIKSERFPDFVLHTEICEDLWVPIPPSSLAALAGATVLANLSASNITLGKAEYREGLVVASSGKNLAVQLYAAAGFGESTTDLGWDGDGYIAERGYLLKRTKRFQLESNHIVVDADLSSLISDRMRQSSFRQNSADHFKDFRVVKFNDEIGDEEKSLNFERSIDPHPFVPKDPKKRNERCREIFMIQATSLARRLEALPVGRRKLILGVSGGRDSAHALLVAAHALDLIKASRKEIIAITMPGLGTDQRTYKNACVLIRAVGATFKEISVKDLSQKMFQKIGHNPKAHDVTYENVQAWMRKTTELSVAAKEGGMDLGAGDLSELMLGWTTMFADHASHYGINVGVPKTLISYLIKWSSAEIFKQEKRLQKVLLDILDTPISPELLPPKDGEITHKTEEIIGPYELHDFFGYYFLRFGFKPSKIARLSLQAFAGKYSISDLKKWFRVFIQRFFDSQRKRSCLPDGPKVGSVAISPRGDWRMPSDALPNVWLEDLDRVPQDLV